MRVAFLCMLAQTFDGFDISSMAVPALIRAWHLPGPAFSNTFVMSSVGIVIGALASGPVGDRVGRKPVLIASLVLLAISSLGCTQVRTVPELVWLRLVTGLGIGMLMPASVALASDYLPDRLRAGAIMVVFTGAPLGGFLGKVIVAELLSSQGWPVIFWIGGLLPLALIPVLLLWLPESPRVLLARGRLTESGMRLMRQLSIDLSTPAEHVDVVKGNPVTGLFRDGLGTTTILIWILYFSNLLSMYLISYWMPTVLSLSGLTPADAVFASSMQEAGPLLSVFLIVPLATRFGPPNVLRVMLFMGILAIGTIGLVICRIIRCCW